MNMTRSETNDFDAVPLRTMERRRPHSWRQATLLTLAFAGVLAVLPLHRALGQEAPPTGRILRWIDNNPAGAVDHWQWRAVTVPESPWNEIHGATQLELNGIFYGIAFPPSGVLDIEIRAIGNAGGTTTVASQPSNSIRVPSCFDSDVNRDGIVGGPDFAEFAAQWAQPCTVNN